MSAKEKKAVKAKAEAALKEIQSGKKTIKKVAKEQNYSNTDESYAAGESEEGEAFEGVMKGMKDGDIADKVLECNNGYVIAKLVAYTDKEETASNKKSLKEQKQSEAFQKKYDNWTKKLEKKWDLQQGCRPETLGTVIFKECGFHILQKRQKRQQLLSSN